MKAFLVDIHTGKTCLCWWTAKAYENCHGIPCDLGDTVWFCNLALYSPHQQLPTKGRRFILTSVAELGIEIADSEEHLCWPGKVTKSVQCKVYYFCILHLLCKAFLRKPKEKVWDVGFFSPLLPFTFLVWLTVAIKLNVSRLYEKEFMQGLK